MRDYKSPCAARLRFVSPSLTQNWMFTLWHCDPVTSQSVSWYTRQVHLGCKCSDHRSVTCRQRYTHISIFYDDLKLSKVGQWRIQDFWQGDAAGSGPHFSEEMTPTFLRQIVSAHRRRQDFPEGGCRQGVDPGFLVGGDGGAEGPERGAVGAKRRGRWGLKRGAVAAPRYGGLRA